MKLFDVKQGKIIGKMELKKPFRVDDFTLIIKDIKEGSLLSYRYDPAIPFLWTGGILVVTCMGIRSLLYILG